MEFLREFARGLARWPNRIQTCEGLVREALLIRGDSLAAQLVQAGTPALDDLLRAGPVAQRHAYWQLLGVHRRQQHRDLEALDGKAGVRPLELVIVHQRRGGQVVAGRPCIGLPRRDNPLLQLGVLGRRRIDQ